MTIYVDNIDTDTEQHVLEPMTGRYIHAGTTTKYYGDDQCSGVNYHVYVHDGMTEDELKELAQTNYPGSHCTHSYDCCGRTYGDRGRLLFANKDTALIEQSWHVNV